MGAPLAPLARKGSLHRREDPMQFPEYRPRRMRRTESLRRLVRETQLSADALIYPVFVRGGKEAHPIASMPGVSQVPIDGAVKLAEECARFGVPAMILF